MMADHFVDDEAQEFFGEIGVEFGIVGQLAQALYLPVLARRVGGRERGAGFILADSLGDLEPLSQHEYQRGIDIVDGIAISG